MSRILLTAYEPYDHWETNVSQLVLERLDGELSGRHEITSQVYPVAFSGIRDLLAADLSNGFEYAIHMGQAPGYQEVTLEAIGINVAVERGQSPEEGVPLVAGGAAAFQSTLPLRAWAQGLRAAGIPARVSYHAGTYLCNAALYLSHYESQRAILGTQSVFLHLPIAPEQLAGREPATADACLPLEASVRAVRWILEQLPSRERTA